MDYRTAQMCKGEQLFCFRYGPGSEDRVIEELMHLAEDKTCELGWQDAVELSLAIVPSSSPERRSPSRFSPSLYLD
jgi:hypothetical protein